jgi:DNA-binding transcriptional regulator YiaG
VKHSRTKTLPDAVFDTLWTEAPAYENVDFYINAYTNPANQSYINFKPYGISYLEACAMLKTIHSCANMDIRDVIDLTGLGKAKLSHILCIPKRTIENWYYGKRECPAYMKLLLLRQFHLLRLGKYIMTESERTFLDTMPGIYEKHKSGQKPEILETDLNDEEWLAALLPNHGIPDRIETEYSHPGVRELLHETEYLDRLFKKKEKE